MRNRRRIFKFLQCGRTSLMNILAFVVCFSVVSKRWQKIQDFTFWLSLVQKPGWELDDDDWSFEPVYRIGGKWEIHVEFRKSEGDIWYLMKTFQFSTRTEEIAAFWFIIIIQILKSICPSPPVAWEWIGPNAKNLGHIWLPSIKKIILKRNWPFEICSFLKTVFICSMSVGSKCRAFSK